jgi:hypothetical protein
MGGNSERWERKIECAFRMQGEKGSEAGTTVGTEKKQRKPANRS